MDSELLETRFAHMGARLKVREGASRGRNGSTVNLAVDVQRDRQGEFFEIRTPAPRAPSPAADLRLEVVDLQPSRRHLLLLAEEGNRKLKFLCGHDERQWFVAAVPEREGVATVQTAMEALKPAEVRQAQARQKIKTEDRSRRKTSAYVRQGEWFFVPEADVAVEEKLVLHNEALTRGVGSKPHIAEFCYRFGGEAVYVSDRYPRGLTEAAHRNLLKKRPAAKSWSWQVMRRNPQVYVRGRISHPDHKTIVLSFWHRVLMNTEHQSAAMRNVAFLD
jgi:hypothetical protein